MNVKCTQCGIAHNCNFCPNCGTSAIASNDIKPRKKGMSTGGIVLTIFLSIFGVFAFMVIVVAVMANGAQRFNNRYKEAISNSRTEADTAVESDEMIVEDIPYFELSQGEYKVGEDIPAATYDITGISGWGFLWIYKNEALYEKDISTDVISLFDGNDDTGVLEKIYTTDYKNLKLKEGQYIKVQQTIVVGFTAK